jgi:hypothetical protein
MAQGEPQHHLLGLFFAHLALLHAPLKGLRVLATEAPESHLPHPRQQRGDEHLFALLFASPLNHPSGLYRCMKTACHFQIDTATQASAQQRIDKRHGQGQLGHGIETQDHDGPGHRTDALLGLIEVGAIGKPQDLGGHGGVFQDDLRQCRRRRSFVTDDPPQGINGACKYRHVAPADAGDPFAQIRRARTDGIHVVSSARYRQGASQLERRSARQGAGAMGSRPL